MAVGLSGKDADLIKAKKLTRTRKDPDSNIEKILDLGFVGEVDFINPDILTKLSKFMWHILCCQSQLSSIHDNKHPFVVPSSLYMFLLVFFPTTITIPDHSTIS